MKHSINQVSLANGAEGLFIHIPGASVMSFEINFRAGEFLAPPDKWEVAHLMEHLILGANERYPRARQFQQEIEKNGAYSNAFTGIYDINYEAEMADFEWRRVLDLLLTAITKPLFLEDEFWAEYGNVQEELTSYVNNHFRRLSLEMREKMQLLTKTDVERLEIMKNVTPADIREHYARTHAPANMRFIAAGKLNARRQAALTKIFESIELPSDHERFELPPEVPEAVNEPIFVANNTVENLYFYVDTYLRRRLSDSENDALNLVNTLLTETLYSRILGTARERGLVYGMSSGTSQAVNSTNWYLGAQVSDKNAAALFEIIVSEILNVMKGQLKPAEISAAKKYALGRFQRSAQTVTGTAAAYSTRYFFDGVIDDYYKIPRRIKAVKKDTMVQVMRDLFADNLGCLGILGNCDEAFARRLLNQLEPLWNYPKS